MATLSAVVGFGALGGCLERTETLTVEPDGSVLVELRFDSVGRADLYEGDALPAEAGGWLLEEWTEVDDDGTAHYRLSADAVFGPQDPLPERLGEPDDPWAETYLTFPTTLTIEPRLDGVYYHFRRVYPARPWAQVAALRRLLVDEKLKALEGKTPETMTPDDRALAVGAFVDFEVAKLLSFARAAYLEVSPEAPQDRWLAVAREVHALKGKLNVGRIAEFMAVEDEQEREAALAEEVRRWEAEAERTLTSALRTHAGYGGSRLPAFLHRFETLKRAHEVTADLGDDAFRVTVRMPGEIVGHNADAIDGSAATWRFGGERFRDRVVELLVTARVAAPQGPGTSAGR